MLLFQNQVLVIPLTLKRKKIINDKILFISDINKYIKAYIKTVSFNNFKDKLMADPMKAV